MTMANDMLSKQVGPLPVGAWGIVIVGALGMAYMFNKGQSGGGSSEEVLLAEPGVGTGGGQFIYDEPESVSPPAEEATNAAWITKAWSQLVAKGNDPVVVGTALNKYISGDTLTSTEQGLVNMAIQLIGVPPEPFTPQKPPVTPSPISTVITLTQQPKTSLKKRERMGFRGKVTENGKSVAWKVVTVEYRNGGTTQWIAYPQGLRRTNSKGEWAFSTSAYKSRQWRFKVFGTSAVVASSFINVK